MFYKCTLFTLLCFFCNMFSVSSQDRGNAQTESGIKQQIEEVIEDEYVRIPKKDFDQILENRISNHVNSKLNTLIGLTVGLITLLSLFSIFQFNRSKVSNEKLVKAEVNIAAKESILEMQEYFKENIESKLSDMQRSTEQNIEFLKKENENSLSLIHEQINKAKKQVSRAEEYMTNLEVESLKSLIIDKKSYKYPEDLNRTQNLLEDVEANKDKFQIPVVVNLLSYIYYDQKQYNEVNELITQYEKDYNLKSNTYINGALTALYDYHNYNSMNQRHKCIEYLDKSLQLTQGYGEALGLKLEVFMMDYLRNEEDGEKQKAIDNAKEVIRGILNSENKAPAYETISRLVRDARISSYKKYVVALLEVFPKEMEELLNEANQAAELLNIRKFDRSELTA